MSPNPLTLTLLRLAGIATNPLRTPHKALEGRLTGTYRLRVGDWRVRFRRLQGGAIYVIAVRNRGDAY
jgi:mRNA-degrading endonuclease RelE of RelBE toxin-antitoxin system